MAITDPRDIPGLKAWYSAQYESAYADGATMTQWTDLSGNNNHAPAGSTAPQWKSAGGPSGGPSIEFSGNRFFTLPTSLMTGATSAEVLFNLKASAGNNGLWNLGTAGSLSHFTFSGNIYDAFASTTRQGPLGSPGTTWHRYAVRSATNWTAWLDGAQQLDTPSTFAWPAAPLLGKSDPSYFLNGQATAFILYNRQLTTAERADLDAWLVANPSGGTIPPPVPLIVWNFEETTGSYVEDSSGNAYPGELFGTYTRGAPTIVPGGTGYALDLAGNAAVRGFSGAPWPLANPPQFSGSLWIKPNSLAGNPVLMAHDYDGATVYMRWRFQIDTATGKLSLIYRRAGDAAVLSAVSTGAAVALSAAQKVAFSCTGTSIQFYLNNQLNGPALPIESLWSPTSGKLEVGGLMGGSVSGGFNGIVDQARYYTVAVPASEFAPTGVRVQAVHTQVLSAVPDPNVQVTAIHTQVLSSAVVPATNVTLAGIATAEAFGTPAVREPLPVTPTAIPSGEAHGNITVSNPGIGAPIYVGYPSDGVYPLPNIYPGLPPIVVPAPPVPRLVWDILESRYFEAGLDRGVLYPRGGQGVAWNGLMSVEEDGADGPTSFYIDGRAYLHKPTPKEFTATLTAYTYPDEFAEMLGTVQAASGMFLDSQVARKFDLCYRTKVGNAIEGLDHGYKIHLIYNATVTADSLSYESISDSINPTTFSWKIQAVPVGVPGIRSTAHLVVDSRKLTPEKLEAVENLLYGGGATMPAIPDPQVIYDLLGFGDDIVVTDNGDGTFDVRGSYNNVYMIGDGTFQVDNVIGQDNNDGTFTISSTTN